MLDSLTFEKEKRYWNKILERLPKIFKYKRQTLLQLRREIINKHLPVPKQKNKLGAFWRREMAVLKRLIEKYPDEQFWLKVNFKPIPIKLKYGNKVQQLYSLTQLFNWPFKDELDQKYKQSKIKLKEIEEVKVSEETFGENIEVKQKPKNLKDFLNYGKN